MKKLFRIISAFLASVFLLCSVVGCAGAVDSAPQLPKLDTPKVTISSDGLATWDSVDKALYYAYVIDEGEEMLTDERKVQLANDESVKVKAVSGSGQYADSDFSQYKTYVASTVQRIKLGTPQVTVNADGVATWNAISNAQYYVYVINNGTETKTPELTVQLADNQKFKVKAGSDDEDYEYSDYSRQVTYTADKPIAHAHVDANSDKICDDCGKSVMAELSFLAVNDLHGKFMDTDNQPGLDEFTTYLKNLYADTAREEVLLSSGDMWQGTVESSTNKGKLMTEWMNEVGFVSMTLGNHEYDWGSAVLTPNSKLAEFPFLAINITYNGKKVDYCQPSTVVEKGGIKIGIIGAIGDCLSSISGDFKAGLSFATGDALTSLVKTEADRLRNSEGCEFIVYSIHEGYGSETTSISDYYDESLSDGYVDLIFEGHTHQSYIKQDEYGVYHLQGGGENRYVSQADVSYNTVTKQYTVTPRTLSQSIYANSSLKDDPIVNQIFNKYFPDINPYTTVLGTNSSRKDDTAICDTVAQLYYEKGVELWGSEYDIVLGGGFLKSRSPYYVAAGNVTYASLFSVLTFDNDIVLGKISGYYLKLKFLETTNSNYHVYAPTIAASSVNNNTDYYIIVDSYTSTYASNRITEVKRWKSEKYARDLLADYVTAGGWA
ncbi:MAG: metallophosphoesterase [Clostridiales bacterium]|nr:metallophosphoesterase [Clostridiales bacterium]